MNPSRIGWTSASEEQLGQLTRRQKDRRRSTTASNLPCSDADPTKKYCNSSKFESSNVNKIARELTHSERLPSQCVEWRSPSTPST